MFPECCTDKEEEDGAVEADLSECSLNVLMLGSKKGSKMGNTLVKCREYAHFLATFYWKLVENILTFWHPSIVHMSRICSLSGSPLLVTYRKYAHFLASFYWSHVENALTTWHSPIGHMSRIRPLSGIPLLVKCREYAHFLAFHYWSHAENMLTREILLYIGAELDSSSSGRSFRYY
jgi:hypothetical protein